MYRAGTEILLMSSFLKLCVEHKGRNENVNELSEE